jgi:hypothetical protein
MTYTLIWSGEVIRALNRLRREEPDTARILTGAILGLASDPRPTGSNRLAAQTSDGSGWVITGSCMRSRKQE